MIQNKKIYILSCVSVFCLLLLSCASRKMKNKPVEKEIYTQEYELQQPNIKEDTTHYGKVQVIQSDNTEPKAALQNGEVGSIPKPTKKPLTPEEKEKIKAAMKERIKAKQKNG